MLSHRQCYCLLLLAFLNSGFAFAQSSIIHYIVNPQKQNTSFYWKDENNNTLQSIQHLKDFTARQHKKLVFAMNGGMYMENHSPLGLYIQDGNVLAKLNRRTGTGNFYLQPNGVFYLTTNKEAVICKTGDFKMNKNIKYATQSGPMLVTDDVINPVFAKGSQNLNIRNGVGILPDGRVVMAISSAGINFYDFAMFFKMMGCRNALYLDGFVSRMYLPEKGQIQLDGDFGVMVGIIE